jgi:4'-phosphopantetheinyl transferase EntD
MLNHLAIRSLVPASTAVAEFRGFCTGTLLPEEDAALGNVVPKRRHDFTVGRECARRALQQLGISNVPILPGPARQPMWPPGICGSITHCRGYGAAVVAKLTDISCIGIDAECQQELEDDLFERIALPEEREWIEDANASIPWRLLLFSAKESVFKAWFPLVGTWLGFEHARIEFDVASGSIRAAILHSAPGMGKESPAELAGRFYVDASRVLTSAFISRHQQDLP